MPSVVAIVVTYNGTHWIEKCLSSLTDSNIPIQTIVVDNGSTDGSQQMIKELFPNVELIESNRNLGFGKANNLGLKKAMEEAQADYVLLLNQDSWIEPETVQELMHAFESDSGYGIVSPVPYDGKGEQMDYLYKRFYRHGLKPKENDRVNVQEIQFINAACWLVNRNTLLKLGGFHPDFYMYGEDRNYIHRLHKVGLKVGVIPGSRYFHDRASREKGHDNRPNRFFKKRMEVKVNLYNPNVSALKAFGINAIGILQNSFKVSFWQKLKLEWINLTLFLNVNRKRDKYQPL
jgi:N-acetylglucosaminyl-diphospho-decaprenol L-rhamnosyltransferase